MPLSSLEVHKVVVGEIEEIHLFHGIFVDIGAEKLGWIAMGEEAWLKMGREDPDLHMRLMPGNKLKCRVRPTSHLCRHPRGNLRFPPRLIIL